MRALLLTGESTVLDDNVGEVVEEVQKGSFEDVLVDDNEEIRLVVMRPVEVVVVVVGVVVGEASDKLLFFTSKLNVNS